MTYGLRVIAGFVSIALSTFIAVTLKELLDLPLVGYYVVGFVSLFSIMELFNNLFKLNEGEVNE